MQSRPTRTSLPMMVCGSPARSSSSCVVHTSTVKHPVWNQACGTVMHPLTSHCVGNTSVLSRSAFRMSCPLTSSSRPFGCPGEYAAAHPFNTWQTEQERLRGCARILPRHHLSALSDRRDRHVPMGYSHGERCVAEAPIRTLLAAAKDKLVADLLGCLSSAHASKRSAVPSCAWAVTTQGSKCVLGESGFRLATSSAATSRTFWLRWFEAAFRMATASSWLHRL